MITSNGKAQLKRFYARQVGDIADSLGFGVGATAASLGDVRLGYEVVRVPILSINVDPGSDRIVFRAQVQPGQIKTIYEIGLWASGLSSPEATNLSLLDGPSVWTNGTLSSSNARISTSALQVNYVANGTTNAEVSGFLVDLSRYSDADAMVVAYHATTNLSSVRVRLGTDATNYYEWLLPAPVANGYNIARVSRSAATKTGTPDWAAVTYAAIRPSATAGGSGSIFLDGIRFESNSLSVSNLLVARSVITPSTIDPDVTSDVEYSVRITTT